MKVAGDDEAKPPVDMRLVAAGSAVWVGCLIAIWAGPAAGWGTAAVALVGAFAISLSRTVARATGIAVVRGVVVCLICLAAAAAAAAVRLESATDNDVHQLAAGGAWADVVAVIDGDPLPLANRLPGALAGSTGGRFLIRATTESVTAGNRSWRAAEPITAFVVGSDWATVVPGQHVRTRGRLGVDTFDGWPTLTLTSEVAPTTVAPAPWWQDAGQKIRAAFIRSSSAVGGDAAGLLRGLILGDRTGISPALTQDAKIAGLTHLLAVSGSHFAILCGVVVALFRRAGPRVTAVAGLVFLVGLVIVVRPSSSVLRAAVMGALTLAALVLGRNRSVLPALSAAVGVLLFLQPELAVDPGFVLSVQATAAIILVAPVWSATLQRRGWPAGWADLVVIPLVAHLGTIPVIASLSGSISLAALPANIMVAPVVAPALLLGAVAAGVAPYWPAGAGVLVHLAAPPADWIAFTAHLTAGWPYAVLPWPSSVPGVLALAMLVGLGVLAMRLRKVRVLFVAVLAGAAVVLIPTQAFSATWPPPGWLIVGCEVGQGDGFVLATGAPGEAIVFDSGPEPSVMNRCLQRLGVTAIPFVVLTHLHADHINGLRGVLIDRAVAAVGLGPSRNPPAAWGIVHDAADEFSVPVIQLGLGERLTVGRISLTVLGPDPARLSAALGPNDQSVVVLAQVQGLRLLFSGDIEEAAQQALLDSGQDLRAQILKLPHHGSAKLLPAFVQAVAPSVVMIGVGVGNDFGHPSAYALRLVHDSGAAVLRTDQNGDIAVSLLDGVLSSSIRGASVVQPRVQPPGGDRRRRADRFRTAGNPPGRRARLRARAPTGRRVPEPAVVVPTMPGRQRCSTQSGPGRRRAPRPEPDGRALP